MTGVSKPTILKLLRDLGAACAAYHDRHVRRLYPERVQCDEIWSFNYCKAKNVPTAKAAPPGARDVWLWTGIDADSRLMISYHVGHQTYHDARALALDLAERIYSRQVQITSDGNASYPTAMWDAFGSDVRFAQLIKQSGPETKGNGTEKKYSPARINGTKEIRRIGNADPEHVSTSFVERASLSIRMAMRRYTRLTNAHSKKIENHCHAVAMFFQYYNFCRAHSSLGTSPAVKAGLADHVWTMEELLELLD